MIISTALDGTAADGSSGSARTSQNGRFTVFVSHAENLVQNDRNSVNDIFIHDSLTETIELVSVFLDGQQIEIGAYAPDVSDNGRYVSFHSYSRILDNVQPSDFIRSTIYVVDRETGDISNVLDEVGIVRSAYSSKAPSISADGNLIVFESSSPYLFADDQNREEDIYLVNRSDNSIELISVALDGHTGNDASVLDTFRSTSVMSSDGRFVVFSSLASNLVSDDNNSFADVFIRDRQLQTTSRVSESESGIETDGASFGGVISGDGRFVAFVSRASNLTADSGVDQTNIYLWDRINNDTTLIGRPILTGLDLGPNSAIDISDDGQFIVFHSKDLNEFPEDVNNEVDIFVYDRITRQTEIVSFGGVQPDGMNGGILPTISGNGHFIYFSRNQLLRAENPFVSVPSPTNNAPINHGRDYVELQTVSGQQVSYDFGQYISDPDGDTLIFSLGSSLPAGLTLDSATGVISGVTSEVGWDHPLILTASDGRGGSVYLELSLAVVPPAQTEWDFSQVSTPDLLTFGHLATDSYNGDVFSNGVTTTLRSPTGWSVLMTTWDGQGSQPRDASGNAIFSIALTGAYGMQATAYREDATGRIVVAYRGTDGDGVSPNSELMSTSIPLGLGQSIAADDLQAAIDFYTHLIEHTEATADNTSFTGHSLGGMYAGFMAGATASQGMIFASGPHTEMNALMDEISLSGDSAFGFIQNWNEFDFAGLYNTRVTGEILMGAVDTSVQVVQNLDHTYTAISQSRPNWITTALGSGTGALLDAFGGADVLGTDLPELQAGQGNFWRLLNDGLNPMELHSMPLHLLLAAIKNDTVMNQLLSTPGFFSGLFEDGVSTSARQGAGIWLPDPDNASAMLRDIVLSRLDPRTDVFTPLMNDAAQIVDPLFAYSYGFETQGFLGPQPGFETSDLTAAVSNFLVEYAYRSLLNDGGPAPYIAQTFLPAGVAGWQTFDLNTQNGGGWFAIQNLLERISASGRAADGFYLGDNTAFDIFALRAGTVAGAYTGSSQQEIIVGLQNPDGSGNNIEGAGGDDLLIGTTGNDTLSGGIGYSLLLGGDGNDTYILTDEGAPTPNNRAHITILDTGGDDRIILDVLGAYSERIDQYSPHLDLYAGDNSIRIVDFFHGAALGWNGERIHGSGYIEDIYSSGRSLSFVTPVQSSDGNATHVLVDNENYVGQTGFLVASTYETPDVIVGSSSDLLDTPTVIFGFDERDSLRLSNDTGEALTPEHFGFRDGSIIVDIDFDLDGTFDSFIRLAGDYEGYEVQIEIDGNEAVLSIENTSPDYFDQTGTGGADTLTAADVGERITGLQGDDVLLGRDGDDTLFGGPGEDNLQGWGGVNEMHGGSGNDTYHVWNEQSRVYEFFGEGEEDIVYAYADYTQPLGVEYLFLSADAQRGTGNAEDNNIAGNGRLPSLLEGLGGDDFIQAGNGDDSIDGGNGNDLIFAGGGNDVIAAEAGADNVRGLAGNDTIVLGGSRYHTSGFVAFNASSENQVGTQARVGLEGLVKIEAVIDGGDDYDTVQLSEEGDAFFLHDAYSSFHSDATLTLDYLGRESTARIASIEDIMGMGGDDIIDLTSPDYSLTGTELTIDGGEGNDVIWGSDATENIFGGSGDDTIFGGIGTDVLTGGLGADVFEFTRTSTNTIVTDFDVAEGDILRFYNVGDAEFDTSSVTLLSNAITISFTDTASGTEHDISIALAVNAADFTATLPEILGALEIL